MSTLERDFSKIGWESHYFQANLAESTQYAGDAISSLVGYGGPEGFDQESVWQESLAKALADLHDGVSRRGAHGLQLPDTYLPPEMILVAATGATPFAYAVKEFWEKAYQTEKPPLFRIIDPSSAQYNGATWGLISQLGKIKDQTGIDSNVAVFDCYSFSGNTMSVIGNCLQKAGYSDVNFLCEKWSNLEEPTMRERPIARVSEKRDEPGYNTLRFNSSYSSRAIIKDMRLIGQMMVEAAADRGRL